MEREASKDCELVVFCFHGLRQRDGISYWLLRPFFLIRINLAQSLFSSFLFMIENVVVLTSVFSAKVDFLQFLTLPIEEKWILLKPALSLFSTNKENIILLTPSVSFSGISSREGFHRPFGSSFFPPIWSSIDSPRWYADLGLWLTLLGRKEMFLFPSPSHCYNCSEPNVLFISMKSYLDVEKFLASPWARVGQAFGGMAVGWGALSEAAIK